MRRWLFEFLIRYLARELSDIPKETLEKNEYDGLLSTLWQNAGFRKYVADRDAKLIWTMAGSEGMEPEPREKYLLHCGQRVENLLLAREAKQAYMRTLAHAKERAKDVVE